MNALFLLKRTSYWIVWWLLYSAAIVIVGTLCGSIIGSAMGFLSSKHTCFEFLRKGAWIGFRYAGVWAGGSALVLCIIRAHRLYYNKK